MNFINIQKSLEKQLPEYLVGYSPEFELENGEIIKNIFFITKGEYGMAFRYDGQSVKEFKNTLVENVKVGFSKL